MSSKKKRIAMEMLADIESGVLFDKQPSVLFDYSGSESVLSPDIVPVFDTICRQTVVVEDGIFRAIG